MKRTVRRMGSCWKWLLVFGALAAAATIALTGALLSGWMPSAAKPQLGEMLTQNQAQEENGTIRIDDPIDLIQSLLPSDAGEVEAISKKSGSILVGGEDLLEYKFTGGVHAFYSPSIKKVVRMFQLVDGYQAEKERPPTLQAEEALKQGKDLLKRFGVPFLFADGLSFKWCEEVTQYYPAWGTWHVGGQYLYKDIPTQARAWIEFSDSSSELVHFMHFVPTGLEEGTAVLDRAAARIKADEFIASYRLKPLASVEAELIYAFPSNFWKWYSFNRYSTKGTLVLSWVFTIKQDAITPPPPFIIHIDAETGKLIGGGH